MLFVKKDYYQEKFSNLDFGQKTISSIEFEECQFKKCTLIDCKLEACRFINCQFKDCVLSAILPTNSSFQEVGFVDSKVIGFDWTKTKKVLSLSFKNCQINYSNFKLLKLPKIKIINSQALEVDFTETDLSEGDFEKTDFAGSRFLKTNLTKVNFKKAKNYQISPQHNYLKGAVFSLPEAISLLEEMDILLD